MKSIFCVGSWKSGLSVKVGLAFPVKTLIRLNWEVTVLETDASSPCMPQKFLSQPISLICTTCLASAGLWVWELVQLWISTNCPSEETCGDDTSLASFTYHQPGTGLQPLMDTRRFEGQCLSPIDLVVSFHNQHLPCSLAISQTFS